MEVLQDLEREKNDDEEEFMNLHEADDLMLADLIRENNEQKNSEMKVCLDFYKTNNSMLF